MLQDKADTLEHVVCQKRGCSSSHRSVRRVISLNIKNSKRQALKALRDQGLSIVTANPSEFGLKGVNSPLL